MVKEVGDKINGARSGQIKKPRPKSLPSQGIRLRESFNLSYSLNTSYQITHLILSKIAISTSD